MEEWAAYGAKDWQLMSPIFFCVAKYRQNTGRISGYPREIRACPISDMEIQKDRLTAAFSHMIGKIG